MRLIKYTCYFIMMLAFTSCGSSDGGDDPQPDQTKPTITIAGPLLNASIAAGNVLQLNIDLTDDVALDNYVLKISLSGTKSVKTVEEFSFNSITDTDSNGNSLPNISGEKLVKLNFGIAITETAQEGNYTLTLSVSDEAGNQQEENIEFTITRI
jgi:hypothetical protein